MSESASLRGPGRRLEEAQSVVRALGAEEAAALPDALVSGVSSPEELRALASELVVALRTIDLTKAAIESDRRYRLLAENISDVIWILDMETQRFRYVSPSVEKLRGFTPAEVIAQTAEEAMMPESFARLGAVLPERLAAFLQGARRTEKARGAPYEEGAPESYIDEIEQSRKDGTTVWTETVTRFVVDPESGRLEVYGTSRDITERKKAEQALHKLSRIHRTLSATNEAIVRATSGDRPRATSEDELLQRVCDVTVEHLGARAATVFALDESRGGLCALVASGPARGVVMSQVLPIDIDAAESAISVQAYLQGTVVVEDRFQTNPVRERWSGVALAAGVGSAIALPITRGGRLWAVFTIAAAEREMFDAEIVRLFEGMARDLSHGLDHIARGEALRESEERYRLLVENMDDFVYSVDVTGRLTFVSGAIAWLGISPRDVVGRSVLEIVHPQDVALVRAAITEALAGQRQTVEHRSFDASGKTRFVRVSMRPVIAGGEVAGLSGVVTDLTRQREIEEQLRMAQKMEAIGRLAGGIAHDFNNLLLVIMSYTELAMEELPEGEAMRADLDEVRKASLRAAGLTRQLLAFSRKQVMRTEMVDVTMLVSGLEKMLQRLLGEDVDLVFRSGPGVQQTRADPGQLEQVIMNLAVNSRDAMPAGGTLVIEVDNAELDAERASHILDATPGAYVRLAITDDGTGMDEATQARVFEPFFTTKEAGKGTGLGLATVYGIVKQTGGCIALQSAKGTGTRFEIFLPVARSARANEHGAAPSHSRMRGQETVLLVEDEEVVRSLVRRVLSGAGYQVIVARTGEEALSRSAEHRGPIHVLVTDVVMPGMNGRELADRIGQQRPSIKVLYTSGYTDDVLEQRGALRPGARFLAKPYLADVLLQEVRAVIEAAE